MDLSLVVVLGVCHIAYFSGDLVHRAAMTQLAFARLVPTRLIARGIGVMKVEAVLPALWVILRDFEHSLVKHEVGDTGDTFTRALGSIPLEAAPRCLATILASGFASSLCLGNFGIALLHTPITEDPLVVQVTRVPAF